MNGSGTGGTSGEPCAGCVGRADNKNPPGQQPGPQDHNNGYECDGNHGIALGNPAHTACASSTPGGCVPTAANDFCGNGGGSGCVPDASNDFCGNGGQSGCVPDVSNNNCTSSGGGGELTSGAGAEASFVVSSGPATGTAPLAGPAPAAGSGLAFTGSNPVRLTVLGLLLVISGLLIAGAAQRKRRVA